MRVRPRNRLQDFIDADNDLSDILVHAPTANLAFGQLPFMSDAIYGFLEAHVRSAVNTGEHDDNSLSSYGNSVSSVVHNLSAQYLWKVPTRCNLVQIEELEVELERINERAKKVVAEMYPSTARIARIPDS